MTFYFALGAMTVTQYLSTMLFGLTPLDVLTFASVSTAFLLVALAACYVPARRATKVGPIVALGYE